MESSNAALRRKNDAAAARELRELREDTLKGLNYLQELKDQDFSECIDNAIQAIEESWPS